MSIYKIKLSETHIKGALKDYLAALGIFSYPIMQGMGSYPGLPDRVIHYRGEVIYLEVKTPKGKQSQYQVDFEEQCGRDGIKYWLVRSVEELMDLLGVQYE